MEPRSNDLAAWRDRFRREEIGPSYLGWLHFGFTSCAALAVIALAISRLGPVRAWEWALLPAFFLIANLGEYLGHRGPMHHRREGLGLVFERHTLQHHRFFTADAMSCESPRDFKIVLFPPVLFLFFLGLLAAPIGAVFCLAVSMNAGLLFAIVAVGYFLLYEWLHFCYHQPAGSLAGRLPIIATLRRHHQAHHDPALMTRWNFNLTFPLGDLLFGTVYRRRGD